MPTWCVSIALVMNGEIEIGVIHDPNVDELYAARRGGGTFLNGKRQPVPPARSLKDGLFGTGFSHRSRPEDVVPFIDALLRDGGMFMRNGSGALMLAYVAVGRLRSEEHTSELQSLMRNSNSVFCLQKKKHTTKMT